MNNGFEPQSLPSRRHGTQRDTELQIRVDPCPSVVDSSGGSDRTHLDDRNATMPGLTFLG